ncbi:MAG: tyrosine-protein phosphatase [Clostridia bacterium]|nr:tyrosine-protein phosphatase [Clostridia bacterium]
MKKIIKIPLLLLIFVLILVVVAVVVFVKIKKNAPPSLGSTAISHDEQFGGVYINCTIDDFNKLGFAYGDSVNVSFSNGYTINDIPYYNGYYVDEGELLLLAYPKYNYIKVGYNYGDDLWKVADISRTDRVSIVLNEKGKYIKNQQANDMQYSNEQGDTPDEQFGNFRNVKVGNIKENVLYRSASPIDNVINRSEVVDKLINEAKIQYVINLADDYANIENCLHTKSFNSPYYKSLYNSDKVIALSMNMQYKSDEFSVTLSTGLTAMAKNEGPYLIHCVEGKDRTGFVCMVLEALSGASYQEIVNDYMLTYKNYYGITEESSSDIYKIIKERNIDHMLRYMCGLDKDADLSDVNYSEKAEEYLKSIGMTDYYILKLKTNLTH